MARVILINPFNQALFEQDKKGNVNIWLGIKPRDKDDMLEHGTYRIPNKKQIEDMHERAEFVLEFDRKVLVSLGKFCLTAATHGEMCNMLRGIKR